MVRRLGHRAGYKKYTKAKQKLHQRYLRVRQSTRAFLQGEKVRNLKSRTKAFGKKVGQKVERGAEYLGTKIENGRVKTSAAMAKVNSRVYNSRPVKKVAFTKNKIKSDRNIARSKIKILIHRFSYWFVDILMLLRVHKHIRKIKLGIVIIPFILLSIFDDFVIAILVATFNVFACSLIFALVSIAKDDAMVDGKFDYGKYKNIKSRKEVVAATFGAFIAMASVIFGNQIANAIFAYLFR